MYCRAEIPKSDIPRGVGCLSFLAMVAVVRVFLLVTNLTVATVHIAIDGFLALSEYTLELLLWTCGEE